MGRLTAALLTVLISGCAHDWVEVEVSGELMLGSRYIEECASGDLYALLFPTEVAADFTRRVEEASQGRLLFARLRGWVVSSPPSSNVAGSLVVFRIDELATDTCDEQPTRF